MISKSHNNLKMGNLSEQELKELASQLSHPKGENGKQTGYSMNVANDNMICNVIAQVSLKENSKILEIGPGNGKHVSYLFEINSDINYFGADISEVMVEEATNLNVKFTASGKAIFQLSDGEKLDYSDAFFTSVFTVNTLYFWKNPKEYLQEISRILKPKGELVIGFIPKNTMEKIPFSKYGFELYENENVQSLLEEIGFKIDKIISETEEVLSNTGDKKIRTFTIIKALKN